MRVFLDANVLFSGALPNSRMHAFLMFLTARADCVTNAYALSEALRNLELKFPASIPVLEDFAHRCSVSISFSSEVPVALKPKDRPILASAIAASATHLMTGDVTDFGHLFGKTIAGVKVVSPRMLAEELVTLGWLSRES